MTFSPKRVASKTMGTTIYVGKPKILRRKSNGLQHSVWEVSTNIECDLRQSNPVYFHGYAYLDILRRLVEIHSTMSDVIVKCLHTRFPTEWFV